MSTEVVYQPANKAMSDAIEHAMKVLEADGMILIAIKSAEDDAGVSMGVVGVHPREAERIMLHSVINVMETAEPEAIVRENETA